MEARKGRAVGDGLEATLEAPGVIAMIRRYWKMLVAVLGGNLLYFGILYSRLPEAARHRPNQLDWGLLLDFWICVAIYGLLIFRPRSKP